MHTRLLPFLLGALLLAAAPRTSAQEPDSDSDPRLQQARELFDQGAAHHADGRYLLAAQAFEQAHALMVEANHPRAGMILFNIGASLEQIPGREAEARQAYQRFLTEAPGDDPAVQDQIARVQDRIRELNARIDEGGGTTTQAGADQLSPIGPVILGVGGAMLLAGGIIGGVVLAQDGDLSAMCSDGRCPESARGLAEDIGRLALSSDVLFIGGAVVAVVGLILTLTVRESAPDVTAGCGPDGCGVQLQGRF